MRKYTLSTAALRTVQILIALLAIGITAVSLIYLSSFKILMIILLSVCWASVFLFGGIILPIYFRRAVIYISTAEISFHSGVFFRRRQHLRAESVQYCSQIKMPLSGLTGFNFIVLHALGASVILPFLSKKDSEDIITLIDTRLQQE